MTTQEVAEKLVALCREGKFDQVYEELYSPNIISAEPEGGAWGTVTGMEEILKKGQEWNEMVETFHSSEISEPIVAENFFAITMKTNITLKGQTHPINMDEVCVYHVEDGKVVREQFFYTPMPQLV